MLVGILSGCSEWLSLNPENETTEGQLFTIGDGCRSVVNGLYKGMATRDLYGVELQFGIIDCMSRQYTFKNASERTHKKYIAAHNFDYDNRVLLPTIEAIWKRAYNIIANANNLIQNISKMSSNVFAYGDVERQMILGEAYACRGFMHFELLRLFAPALVNDDGKKYIPYVDVYPDIQANGIPIKEYIAKVINDLEKAKDMTAVYDTTSFGMGCCASGRTRFRNKFEYGWQNDAYYVDDFFKGRGIG